MTLRARAVLLLSTLLAGCAAAPPATHPLVERAVEVSRADFDGVTDDLLTGGLGYEGLNAAAPPTGASLRTKAIHANYRAIVDVREAGGFTRLYGPAKDALKIAGTEYVSLVFVTGLAHPIAVAVAIPNGFDPDEPCLFIAPSSGSRGVYGAIGTGGAAGLSHGCAVAFTDKATGTGFVHLASGESYGADLQPTSAREAMLFPLTIETGPSPGEVAVKHAHSRDNVERHWGAATLAAGEHALAVLGRHFNRPFTPEGTLVIAASISNGGKAAVMAAESDRAGLIDGVVASEPNLAASDPGRVLFDGAEIAGAGRALYDVATAMTLYAPCAAMAPSVAGEPGAVASLFAAQALTDWCGRLAGAGLVAGDTLAEQGEGALASIRDLGFAADTDALLHYGVAIKLWPAVAVAYANAYARAGAADRLCGAYYSFAANGAARAPGAEEKANLAAFSSGIPPTAGVDVLYTDPSPSAAFDAALCMRALWTEATPEAARVRDGVTEVRNSGDHRGVPMILLHGRSDALVPVSHATRPYVAAAKGAGALAYYEIEGGQHFDAFRAFPDLGPRLTPMAPYFDRGVDLMLAHLKTGAALPTSQVVRNTPPGPTPLADAHLGGIQSSPGDSTIEIADGTISIPR